MQRIAGVIILLVALVGAWAMGASGSSTSVSSPAGAEGTTAASSKIAAATKAATTPAHVHDSVFPDGNDKGFSLLENGHQHTHTAAVPIDTLSKATQALLRHQLNLTLEVAAKYPTVKDAEQKGGYRRAGPFVPGLGAHWVHMNGRGLYSGKPMTDRDILDPLALIYDGTSPDSPIAGFMYYSFSAKEPEGFAGPNDVWHYHTNICLKQAADGGIDAPLGADRDSSPALCSQVGGYILKQTAWMLHVWTIPAYTSPQGVFAHNSSSVTCADGTFYTVPESQWISHPLNICKNGA